MRNSWNHWSTLSGRYAWLSILIAISLAVIFGNAVRGLSIDSSFKRLLPAGSRSVQALDAIEARVKSTATLHVLVGGADWPHMRHFIDDFVAAVPEELGDLIDRVEYHGKVIGEYFDTNKYLYIDLPDLEEVYERLQRQIQYEKISKSPLFIEFDEAPRFDISDIRKKYGQATTQYQNYRDGYFTNHNASLAVIVLKPKFGATDVGTARELIARTQSVIDTLGPQNYNAELLVGFGGRYPKVITEFETILGDMVRTLGLCTLLIGSIVLLYFRRLRMGILMISAAGLGALAALAVARYSIGYLTAQTAFLGSIIVGNGINYSLILMARYVEERRDHDRSPHDALSLALASTWKPTLASALTTSSAFIVLALAKIQGFSQFGFIGGLGMTICWIFTYTLMPGWLLATERIWPLKFRKGRVSLFNRVTERLGQWIVKSPWRILQWSIGCAAIALFVAGAYLPNALEYDFGNLRFQVPANELTAHPTFDTKNFDGSPEELHQTWERWGQNYTDDVLGGSASPVVIMAEREDQVADICADIEKRGANLYTRAGHKIFGECRSLRTYVPQNQEAKLKLLAKMRALLDQNVLSFLDDEQREEIDTFRETFALTPLTRKDIPETIVDLFRESDGREGLIVYVYPTKNANLWHGIELGKFADLVRKTTLPNGEVIYSSGNPVIFSDLLRIITSDGPIITLCSFACVLVLIWLNFREHRSTIIVAGTLCLGILWMVALLPLFGVKLNFLNFVAFPIAFGIGVDYAVNIYERYRQDGAGSSATVVSNLGSAIFLCSLTTLAGYSVLMISRNGALRSFGLAGLLAEIACLSAALIVLPAYLAHKEQNDAAQH